MFVEIEESVVGNFMFFGTILMVVFGYFAYRIISKFVDHRNSMEISNHYSKIFQENEHAFTRSMSRFFAFFEKIEKDVYSLSYNYLISHIVSQFLEPICNLFNLSYKNWKTATPVSHIFDWSAQTNNLKNIPICPLKSVSECPFKNIPVCSSNIPVCPLRNINERPLKSASECPFKNILGCPSNIPICPLKSINECPFKNIASCSMKNDCNFDNGCSRSEFMPTICVDGTMCTPLKKDNICYGVEPRRDSVESRRDSRDMLMSQEPRRDSRDMLMSQEACCVRPRHCEEPISCNPTINCCGWSENQLSTPCVNKTTCPLSLKKICRTRCQSFRPRKFSRRHNLKNKNNTCCGQPEQNIYSELFEKCSPRVETPVPINKQNSPPREDHYTNILNNLLDALPLTSAATPILQKYAGELLDKYCSKNSPVLKMGISTLLNCYPKMDNEKEKKIFDSFFEKLKTTNCSAQKETYTNVLNRSVPCPVPQEKCQNIQGTFWNSPDQPEYKPYVDGVSPETDGIYVYGSNPETPETTETGSNIIGDIPESTLSLFFDFANKYTDPTKPSSIDFSKITINEASDMILTLAKKFGIDTVSKNGFDYYCLETNNFPAPNQQVADFFNLLCFISVGSDKFMERKNKCSNSLSDTLDDTIAQCLDSFDNVDCLGNYGKEIKINIESPPDQYSGSTSDDSSDDSFDLTNDIISQDIQDTSSQDETVSY